MAQAKTRMRVGKRSGITSAPMMNYPQHTSATFIAGAPVKMSSGNLVACSVTANKGTSSTLTEVAAGSLNVILGFAEGDAASGATGNLPVSVIQEGVEFVGHLIHGTTASAKAGTSMVLKSRADASVVFLGKDDSDTHYGWIIDDHSAMTGSGAGLVKGMITKLVDPASTVNGRVQVRITSGGILAPFITE